MPHWLTHDIRQDTIETNTGGRPYSSFRRKQNTPQSDAATVVARFLAARSCVSTAMPGTQLPTELVSHPTVNWSRFMFREVYQFRKYHHSGSRLATRQHWLFVSRHGQHLKTATLWSARSLLTSLTELSFQPCGTDRLQKVSLGLMSLVCRFAVRSRSLDHFVISSETKLTDEEQLNTVNHQVKFCQSSL